MSELLDNATRARVQKLPAWVRDLIDKLDAQVDRSDVRAATVERLLREHVTKRGVAGGATAFEYGIEDQTYAVPDDADMTVNLGGGSNLGLTVDNGRLVIDGVVAVVVKPVASNSVAVWEMR
jgi:hypothetical protein